MAGAEQSKPNGKPSTHLEVAYQMARGGVEAVRTMAPRPSRRVMRRAADTLEADGEALTAGHLRALIEELHGSGRGGRKPPRVGTTKRYKAFADGAGRVYGRVPLELIGIKRGEAFAVDFNETHIVLRRPS